MRHLASAALVVAWLALLGPTAASRAADTGGSTPAASKEQSEAIRWYEKVVDAYMHSKWNELDSEFKNLSTHSRLLSNDQRSDLTYVRKAASEHRPAWWKDTKSSSNKTFTVTIWGKSFKANYMPSEFFGGALPVDIDPATNRLRVIVTWQPHQVDSPKPLDDELATPHGLTEGDEAEAVIWHELGHNYVTQSLVADAVIELYTNYRLLFSALQEFYADSTALYHCSPQGRKAILIIRVPGLSWNDVNDPHVRGAYGIGVFLLATVLSEPAKWPSFCLPLKAPDTEVERNTMLYMYTHLSPSYTLDEDRRLRELIGQLIRTRGDQVLKTKGTLKLPNRLEYKYMTAEDRDNQTRRDAWVKTELEKAIASGAVKKTEATLGHPKRFRINVPW